MSVILVTGAATGIGRLTAEALARNGHTVWASMRDPQGRNAGHSEQLRELAAAESVDLHIVALDVQSQESADRAVATVVEESGRLDVVVQNAGHLYVGYTEAFTAEDVTRLFDINAVGAHRVNRAALPHLREQRSGTLLYVGSTTTVDVPPFLGPYVASKFAFDALAQVTSYEVSPFGIETVIVMPGAFTSGTDHFANAGRASDTARAGQYAVLDPLVDRNEEATANLVAPGVEAHPSAVATEIVRILDLPVGEKPFRSVIDFTGAHVQKVLDAADAERADFVTRLGFAQLLTVTTTSS